MIAAYVGADRPLLLVAATGAIAVAGLLGILRALVPQRAALDARRPATRADFFGSEEAETADRGSVRRRVGRSIVARLAELGIRFDRIQTDLAMVNRPLEEYIGLQALYTLGGMIVVPLLSVLGAPGQLVPSNWILPGAIVGGLIGLLFVRANVRAEATRRRRDFRLAQAAAMALVASALEAGETIDGALRDVLGASDNSTFVRLRRALNRARRLRMSAWMAFRELGEELGIPELETFANTVELAIRAGTPAREALESATEAVRTNELHEQRAGAAARTVWMSPAVVALGLAPLFFIGFCALNLPIYGPMK